MNAKSLGVSHQSFINRVNLKVSCFVLVYVDNNLCSFMRFKIGYEFDFTREALAMDRIRTFLSENNKKMLVKVPRVIRDVVTR